MSEVSKNTIARSGTADLKIKASNRIVELDALRGLAAMVVVFYHFTTRFDELVGRPEPLMFSVPWGIHGIDLFFMLSGYVILMTLDRTKTVGEFVIGRFSRLYPAFWASVILTFLIVRWAELPGQVVSLGDALLNLTMIPMLLKVPLVDGAYWTLQAELLFYIAMLLLHRLGAFRHVTWTLGVWLALAAASHIALSVASNSPLVSSLVPKLQTMASLKYLHMFAIGIVFYDARRTGWTSAHGAILALSFAIAAGIWTSGHVALDVLFAGLLFAAVSGRFSFLATWPLVKLGAISYTLYLLHENIGFVALRELQNAGCEPHLAVFITIAGAIGLATVLSVVVERPALRAIRAATKPKASPAAEIRYSGELGS